VARFVLPRAPQTDDELYWTVRAMWGVTIPRTKVCPDHVPPFEVFADAFFGRDGSIAFWHGSRGLSGKSYTLSVLGLTKAVLRGADVNLLGGSMNQSTNIHEAMRNALDYENAPREMLVHEGREEIRFTNKAKIRPLTASQKTVRGPHPPFLLLDEIDEMELAILDAALGQPLPQKNWMGEEIKPYTVMCSTWQNPEGTFTAVKRRFEERGMPTKAWCYRESANEVDGWLSWETIEAKKQEIPAEMWRVEYELGEPSIGNRAFDSQAVEDTFSLPFEPEALVKHQVAKDFEYFTFEKPISGATYVVSADWAKEQDYTVIAVTKWVPDEPATLVHWVRVNRRAYPHMVGYFNDAIEAYNPISAIHDGTGVGNMVRDYVDSGSWAFLMTGAQRANMLTEYVNAIERGRYRLPKFQSAYLAHKYAQVGDLYSTSQQYHLPDEVCALALSWRAARQVGVAPNLEPTIVIKDESPSPSEIAFHNPRRDVDPETGEEKLPRDGEVWVTDSEEDASSMSFLV
jgi:hypothetical protein